MSQAVIYALYLHYLFFFNIQQYDYIAIIPLLQVEKLRLGNYTLPECIQPISAGGKIETQAG